MKKKIKRSLNKEDIENLSIEWLTEIGYSFAQGSDIAPNGNSQERKSFKQVILEDRLISALERINPEVPSKTIESALIKLTQQNVPSLIKSNRQFHKWITTGIPFFHVEGNQEIRKYLKVIDFTNIEKNDWFVVKNLVINESENNSSPGIIIFINGLPIAVFELTNPCSNRCDIWDAFYQLQTYKKNIPDLFISNVLLVISDGIYAKVGSLSASEERFQQWRVIEKEQDLDPLGKFKQLETLIRGLFDKKRLLDFIRSFCIFEEEGEIIKKIAGYHQFHAVNTALERVIEASKPDGDRKGGVVWHTQGTGKSIELAFLAGKLLTDKRLQNPTLVLVTDRKDLDGQLFGVFAGSEDLIGEQPKQVESRKDLREILDNRPSGGIIFTTIQKFQNEKDEKFFPTLNDRKNIVVIYDDAHHYGFTGRIDLKTGEVKGLAKNLRDALPNATFLAFTETPIAQGAEFTQAIFGNYVSIYDIQQAVDDGATVPIYYESRLRKILYQLSTLPKLDSELDEIFEDEDDISSLKKNKGRWAALEELVGAETRLNQIAKDIVFHYEKRSKTQPGKAVIVCMSREICVRLYNKLIALRPDWHNEDHMKGSLKVVVSASPSPLLQPQKTSQKQQKHLRNRFKDPNDPLKIVIVRDMWLKGFDAPCLATMYVDKPMKGTNLIQTIGRVNRVFKDKPGGLIVDYIGIAPQLQEALGNYTAASGIGKYTLNISEAVSILLEQIQIAKDLLHPVEWSNFREKGKAFEIIPNCLDRILELEDGKQRYCDTVLKITKAFALCGTTDEAIELSPKIAFLQAMRAMLIKGQINVKTQKKDSDYILKPLFSDSLISEGNINCFDVLGLKNKDIRILSDEFLSEFSKIPQKNLAVELLQKLLNDEVKCKFRTNILKQKNFSEMIRLSVDKYQNRSIESAQVIEELIEMAKKFREDLEKGASLGLSSEEQSFYDALVYNSSVNELMKEEVLANMAKELNEIVSKDENIDWQYKVNIIAKLRVKIKILLKRNKYPTDLIIYAIENTLKQAEILKKESLKKYNKSL